MFEKPLFKKITKLNSKNHSMKNKPYSQELSPLNYSFEYNKNKDQIINNYNVKVNITKKKTKNISIGNITLGNNSDKNILNIMKKDNKLKKISPLHLNLNKLVYEPKKNKKREKGKNKSAFDSPNKSFNKMILNLKNEFEEIKKRGYSGSLKKQKDNSKSNKSNNSNKYNNNNIKENNNKSNYYINNIKTHSINNLTTKFHSITTNSKLNKKRKTNNSSSLEKLKNSSEKNKKTMEVHRVKNFIFKPFSNKNLQKLNFKTEPKAEEKSIKSCYINQLNLDKDDKSSIYFAKSSLYSFRQSPTISFSYNRNKNDKFKKEELIEELYHEIREYKMLVPLLVEYIKIQRKVFLENSYKKYIMEYAKKEYLREIILLKSTNEYLIEQNNKYRKIILNMMLFLEKEYSSSINSQKRISENLSQILKENEYLREIIKTISNINKDFNTTNSSLGTLKSSIDNKSLSIDNSHTFIRRIQYNEDIFSKLLIKQNLELTIKKEEKKRDNSLIKKNKLDYNRVKNKKLIEKLNKRKPLKLSYIKKNK